MSKDNLEGKVAHLFRLGDWEKARRLLEAEREKNPADHWTLTQLGVTFYEQQKYDDALELLLASRKIVEDCPLTLWNLAGTLDALGHHGGALRIYTWLLESKISPTVDPCWESEEWADALKTDALYRLGVCFQNLGKAKKADRCFRQYLNLLLSGAEGMYSLEDVTRHIRELHAADKQEALHGQVRKAVTAALQASPGKPKKGPTNGTPFGEKELLTGRPAANKR